MNSDESMELTCNNTNCSHEFEAEEWKNGSCPKCGLKYACYAYGVEYTDEGIVQGCDVIWENDSEITKQTYLWSSRDWI